MAGHRLGFVVGLRAEARLLRGFLVGIGGGTPAGAARATRSLLDQGVTALISFGFAGGLAPDLPAGSLVVPDAVVTDAATYRCDPVLVGWLGGATVGSLFAGTGIAVTAAEKSELHARTGAAAVDLESGMVAEAAAVRGLPMAVLRAVSDPADRNLPPAAAIAMDDAGAVRLGPIISELVRQPGQIAGLLGLARDAGRARATLRRHVATLARDR